MKSSPLAAFGAVALLASATHAADLTTSEGYAGPASVVARQHIACDEFGRCWREPAHRTVIVQRDRDSATSRGGIVERRYVDRRSEVTGFQSPGVNVDVEDDRW